ncbi:MAG: hypothetical protein WAQ32_08975 [Dethiobacteria bacterium]|nr:hypothetical protein [Mycobacteriales bacterium]
MYQTALAAKKELTELLHSLEKLGQEEKRRVICMAKKCLRKSSKEVFR